MVMVLEVLFGFMAFNIDASVASATGSNGNGRSISVCASEFFVRLPVDISGVLFNASAVRSTIGTAVACVLWVMLGTSRSDCGSG